MAAAPKKSVDTESYAGRFSARIRLLREKSGKTVEQAVDDMNAAGYEVAARSYYNWEQAKASPPINAFPALSVALGLKSIRALLPEK